MIDFETGIDTWVIDKEDSNGSCYSLNKLESSLTSINSKKAVGKENITRVTSSTENNSLRSFRIRKDISYKELSSESDNETKKQFCPDEDNLSVFKKQHNEISKASSYEKRLDSVSTNKRVLSTSLNDLNCTTKEKESLSSGEITLYLSELSNSSDSIHENWREHLQSIENVASLSENKAIEENISQAPLQLNTNILLSSTDEQKPCEFVSNRINSTIDNNEYSQEQNQKDDTFSLKSASLKLKPEFLDSYKTHLTSQYINVDSKCKRNSGLFKGCLGNDNASDKYSLCKQPLFKCNVCSHCCSDLLLHKSHLILFHSEKKTLDCEYCDYKTSYCVNLATHIREHFQLKCPYCDYQCDMETSLESHLLETNGGKTHYNCRKCNFVCKSQIKLKKHSQTHLSHGKYQCSDCSLDFSNKKILKTHVKKHLTKEKSFKCFSCPLSFCKKQQLKIHMRSHEQSYVCDICNFKCDYKQRLETHMKIHTRKSLKCGKCSSIFSSKSNLKLHMRVHFPNSKCHYCPFQSNDPNKLSKHICIKNLYNVQKRTLNFANGIDARCDFAKINKENKALKSSVNPTEIKCVNRSKKSVEEAISSHLPTKSALQRKSRKPNRRRLLSLRSRLPPKIVDKSGKDNKEVHLISESRHIDESFDILRKKNKHSDIMKPVYKTRNSFKQSEWVNDQGKVISAKENNEFGKGMKIKKDHIQSLGLNCTKTLFNNQLTSKEILLEPVRLTNGSYIQCYYQIQPSIITPNHLESHIRQSTLLSCRFCNYKTNSIRLLQRHTAKTHTWDPAVVSMLFR